MLLDRRTLIGGAGAGIAAATMPSLAFPRGASGPKALAIVDERWGSVGAFTSVARKHFVPAVVIRGDVTPIWQDLLDRRLGEGRMLLFGMTGHAAFISLEQMTRRAGMTRRFATRETHVAPALSARFVGAQHVLADILAAGAASKLAGHEGERLLFWLIG